MQRQSRTEIKPGEAMYNLKSLVVAAFGDGATPDAKPCMPSRQGLSGRTRGGLSPAPWWRTLPNVEEAVQVVEPATAEVMEGPLCPLTQ